MEKSVISLSSATEKELNEVTKIYGFPYSGADVYVAKNNDRIIGFAAFFEKELLKIEIEPRFRRYGTTQKLFQFAMQNHFKKNKATEKIILRAAVPYGTRNQKKRQMMLEKWYAQQGGIRDAKATDWFHFMRPKRKETLMQARIRTQKKGIPTRPVRLRGI